MLYSIELGTALCVLAAECPYAFQWVFNSCGTIRVKIFSVYARDVISSFLGPFAKRQKATLIFVTSVSLSVPLSVRIEQLGSYCKDFY
jgi:hypothetical protein